MKRNFNQPLKYFDGKTLVRTEPAGTDEAGNPVSAHVPITLKSSAIDALLAVVEDERGLAGTEKQKRCALSQRIYESDAEIDITSEELALVKTLIGKVHPPLLVGLAWKILEADPAAEAMAGRT